MESMVAIGKNFQHIMFLELSQTNHTTIIHTLILTFFFYELKSWDFSDDRVIKPSVPHGRRECYEGVLVVPSSKDGNPSHWVNLAPV